MNTPIVRPATEQDIEGMILLYTEFHEFHVRGVPDRLRTPDISDNASTQDALRGLLQREGAKIFVADLEGTLVGLAEVYVREDEPNPFIVAHRYGHLQSLIVTESLRKIGLGKQLVRQLIGGQKNRERRRCSLTYGNLPKDHSIFMQPSAIAH